MSLLVVACISVLVLAKVHSLIFLQTLIAVRQMPSFRLRLEAEELQQKGHFGHIEDCLKSGLFGPAHANV